MTTPIAELDKPVIERTEGDDETKLFEMVLLEGEREAGTFSLDASCCTGCGTCGFPI